MLGKYFFTAQGIDLLFSNKELEWNGARVPMPKVRARAWKPGLKPYREEECRHVEITLAESLKNGSWLDDLYATAVSRGGVLEEFNDVASEILGEIKGPHYELPLPPDATPLACRPFPAPHIHLVAIKQEIQRRVRLGVLSPDNSSSWVSPAFTIL
ncbi:hypothetical protein P3T76_011703 [Phytophthora citrophthora]|uniref:Uncharacterized protein n=1 Tax=Phytophthora citrophthora TaxID=4793 RepID=A0AAD9G8T9_9STRA|nr:hypothetical protein P3T76_011703 [Phytophthora citrophthora]